MNATCPFSTIERHAIAASRQRESTRGRRRTPNHDLRETRFPPGAVRRPCDDRTMPPPAAFDPATIEALSHLLGDHYKGSTLTRLLAHARVDDPLAPRETKWKRLDAAL